MAALAGWAAVAEGFHSADRELSFDELSPAEISSHFPSNERAAMPFESGLHGSLTCLRSSSNSDMVAGSGLARAVRTHRPLQPEHVCEERVDSTRLARGPAAGGEVCDDQRRLRWSSLPRSL